MIHAHTISAHRVSDYAGPRFAYTADVLEMPKRCSDPHCMTWTEDACAGCGDPLCQEHAFNCEECGGDLKYCVRCTVLVDDLRNCHRHTMLIPAGEIEL